MLKPEDEQLLAEADAVLMTREASAALLEFLTPFTVPLFFFKGSRSMPWRMGTGVLLDLDRRGYILTAGHVVDHHRNSEACSLTIKHTPHTFVARFERSALVSRPDVGVLEIPADQYEAYRTYDRLYIEKPSRIRILTSDALIAANDWMCVAGYPKEAASITDSAAGMRLVNYVTTLAGVAPAPHSPLPPAACAAVDVWVPPDGQLQAFPFHASDVDVPLFGGASGGGCWKTGARSLPRTYDPLSPQPELVGIHIGSSQPIKELEHARFGREVLVGYHLRLLADAFPDMRDSVYTRWPSVADDTWRVR